MATTTYENPSTTKKLQPLPACTMLMACHIFEAKLLHKY